MHGVGVLQRQGRREGCEESRPRLDTGKLATHTYTLSSSHIATLADSLHILTRGRTFVRREVCKPKRNPPTEQPLTWRVVDQRTCCGGVLPFLLRYSWSMFTCTTSPGSPFPQSPTPVFYLFPPGALLIRGHAVEGCYLSCLSILGLCAYLSHLSCFLFTPAAYFYLFSPSSSPSSNPTLLHSITHPPPCFPLTLSFFVCECSVYQKH